MLRYNIYVTSNLIWSYHQILLDIQVLAVVQVHFVRVLLYQGETVPQQCIKDMTLDLAVRREVSEVINRHLFQFTYRLAGQNRQRRHVLNPQIDKFLVVYLTIIAHHGRLFDTLHYHQNTPTGHFLVLAS